MSRLFVLALAGGCVGVLALEGRELVRAVGDHPFDDTVREVRELAAAERAPEPAPVVVATRTGVPER